jgi:hypothetical protein
VGKSVPSAGPLRIGGMRYREACTHVGCLRVRVAVEGPHQAWSQPPRMLPKPACWDGPLAVACCSLLVMLMAVVQAWSAHWWMR